MLKRQPEEGSIVICDFEGFKIPEIIKKRRVVIFHKHRENRGLVAVVPISLTPPTTIKKYHYKLNSEFCLEHFSQTNCWVKCDMVYVVSLKRLSIQKNSQKGRYIPMLSKEAFENIKEAVRNGLGLEEDSQQKTGD